MGGHLPGAPLRQPDRRSCGAAVVVVARLLRRPTAAVTPRPADFAAEVLARHRQLTSTRDARGRRQPPWPAALGTPPWAVARELAHLGDTPYAVRQARLGSREATWTLLRSATPTLPVAVYVGSRWLPRHVVLVTGPDAGPAGPDGAERPDGADEAVRCYEPASGAMVRLARRDLLAGRCRLAGWDQPWLTVGPALSPRRARRTPA